MIDLTINIDTKIKAIILLMILIVLLTAMMTTLTRVQQGRTLNNKPN
jgi:hypothetical protein